ncbi:hypothetical protein RB195_026025 [Necator americanus]|uniref:Uncharacterized protein n=1 Tax=Necator americanus TaxID=51031 RepID=A0ABR1EV22_NECAM
MGFQIGEVDRIRSDKDTTHLACHLNLRYADRTRYFFTAKRNTRAQERKQAATTAMMSCKQILAFDVAHRKMNVKGRGEFKHEKSIPDPFEAQEAVTLIAATGTRRFQLQ